MIIRTVYVPGIIAVVTARIVSGAALSVPHVISRGPVGEAPAMDRKQAAYLRYALGHR